MSNKNNEYILYLDMDGVLVDFEGAVRKDKNNAVDRQNPTAHEIFTFWKDLPWIQGGKELVKAAFSLYNRVYVLSSAGTSNKYLLDIITLGKRAWLKKNIPFIPLNNVFIVPGKILKQDYSEKNSILVDDMPITIKQWNDKGGYGILHNSRNYKKTIDDLEDISKPIKLSELVKRLNK